MHERFLSFFKSLKTVMRNDGIIRKVWASRKNRGRGKGKTSGVGTDGEIGLVCRSASGFSATKSEESVFTRGECGWCGGTARVNQYFALGQNVK